MTGETISPTFQFLLRLKEKLEHKTTSTKQEIEEQIKFIKFMELKGFHYLESKKNV
jgi:hypothetical protein